MAPYPLTFPLPLILPSPLNLVLSASPLLFFVIFKVCKFFCFQHHSLFSFLLRKMQSTLQIQRQESSQIQRKLSISVDKIEQSFSFGHKNGGFPMSPRTRPACTCSNRPGSARCARHGCLVPPGERLKKRPAPASKEILRRALTPPPRRFAFRSLNFRPTPSRLSQMSMA